MKLRVAVAAPKLLKACKRMLNVFRHIPVEAVEDYEAVEKARKSLLRAVAKADPGWRMAPYKGNGAGLTCKESLDGKSVRF